MVKDENEYKYMKGILLMADIEGIQGVVVWIKCIVNNLTVNGVS